MHIVTHLAGPSRSLDRSFVIFHRMVPRDDRHHDRGWTDAEPALEPSAGEPLGSIRSELPVVETVGDHDRATAVIAAFDMLTYSCGRIVDRCARPLRQSRAETDDEPC